MRFAALKCIGQFQTNDQMKLFLTCFLWVELLTAAEPSIYSKVYEDRESFANFCSALVPNSQDILRVDWGGFLILVIIDNKNDMYFFCNPLTVVEKKLIKDGVVQDFSFEPLKHQFLRELVTSDGIKILKDDPVEHVVGGILSAKAGKGSKFVVTLKNESERLRFSFARQEERWTFSQFKWME